MQVHETVLDCAGYSLIMRPHKVREQAGGEKGRTILLKPDAATWRPNLKAPAATGMATVEFGQDLKLRTCDLQPDVRTQCCQTSDLLRMVVQVID